ncbi:MAG: glycosyltransferase, partial [Fluviicola sp.]
VTQLYEDQVFDAMLSLSDSEGVPFSMMEAMAHEIPVLTTDVGGVPELVHPNQGLMFSVYEDEMIITHQILDWFNRSKEIRLLERQLVREVVEKHFQDNINFTDFAEWLAALKDSFPDKTVS